MTEGIHHLKKISDPLYSLLFLTADFLPGPRLTWSGVLDTRSQRIIREAEPLGE